MIFELSVFQCMCVFDISIWKEAFFSIYIGESVGVEFVLISMPRQIFTDKMDDR